MGHYDNCRDGYCGKCGAAPSNIIIGKCEFCFPKESRPENKAMKKLYKKTSKLIEAFDNHIEKNKQILPEKYSNDLLMNLEDFAFWLETQI